MHVAGGEHLAHGGVNDREAGASRSPGGEVRGVVGPFDVGVEGFEGFVHAERERGGG